MKESNLIKFDLIFLGIKLNTEKQLKKK